MIDIGKENKRWHDIFTAWQQYRAMLQEAGFIADCYDEQIRRVEESAKVEIGRFFIRMAKIDTER